MAAPRGTTSIRQAVEMREETDTRPPYLVFGVLPVVLVLLGTIAASAAVVFYVGEPAAYTPSGVQTWLGENVSDLAAAGGIVLLSVLAATVLFAVGAYKVIERRNGHLTRDRLLRQGLVDYAREMADESQEDAERIEALERLHNTALLEEDERPAGLHLLITFLTFGLWLLFIVFFMLKDLPRHTRLQARFTDQATALLQGADVLTEGTPSIEPIAERSFMLFAGLFVALPAVGAGLLGALAPGSLVYAIPLDLIQIATWLVFWYWIFEDPLEHLDQQHAYEDTLVAALDEAPAPAGAGGPGAGPTQEGSPEGGHGEGGDMAAGGTEEGEAEEQPAFTVWACGDCGKRYKVPPKRPVRVTCKDCGNQEILKE